MAGGQDTAFEVNFDGLVGPTHNYAGLSYGNVASSSNRDAISNPQEAALQGLAKMRELANQGLKQAVLPPQERPDLWTLRKLGFSGTDAEVLRKAATDAPEILAACGSASSMWTANAATVAPSADTADKRVHFTPANLSNKFHRSIEHETTGRALQAIFRDDKLFAHHPALPQGSYFGDEGAANHTRFCEEYGKPGVQFFVYGRQAFRAGEPEPKLFPARQTLEASQAVARNHGLDLGRTVFALQNPIAIDAGVFHNDVASVGNRDLLFYHEHAFYRTDAVLKELADKFAKVSSRPMRFLRVSSDAVSLEDAVKSYLFNSQLLSLPHQAPGDMALVAPLECQERPSVKKYLDGLLKDMSQPIREIHYYDLRQSMRNGGGPACLRLRVVLSAQQLARANQQVFFSPGEGGLYATLTAWVKRHYRTQLTHADLADPKLVDESRRALDELTRLLGLGSIYPFQLGRG